ncbi:hypothetical protein FNV43_RR24821 [Rhamnella rubrinervis]|uniref:Uncharacterized protein n=1 Tax=Rhamnella rubrinervis TaxID=2594499 RepID=A0A8K0DR99_9ROSA|nr:hypothetical protein FNV43_RR24821 [Rhamnella rubrinervis]
MHLTTFQHTRDWRCKLRRYADELEMDAALFYIRKRMINYPQMYDQRAIVTHRMFRVGDEEEDELADTVDWEKEMKDSPFDMYALGTLPIGSKSWLDVDYVADAPYACPFIIVWRAATAYWRRTPMRPVFLIILLENTATAYGGDRPMRVRYYACNTRRDIGSGRRPQMAGTGHMRPAFTDHFIRRIRTVMAGPQDAVPYDHFASRCSPAHFDHFVENTSTAYRQRTAKMRVPRIYHFASKTDRDWRGGPPICGRVFDHFMQNTATAYRRPDAY